MTDKEDSDKFLKNLTPATGGSSSTEGGGSGKSKKSKYMPNQRPAGRAGRISARRIGGPNLGADFENYRKNMMGLNTSNAPSGQFQSVPVTNLGSNSNQNPNQNATQPQPTAGGGNRLGATLPRVQELGGSNNNSGQIQNPSRKNSSRVKFNRRSKRLSSASSNHSETTSMNNSSKEMIIRYGELLKRAVVSKQWNKRFFVLTDRQLLYFQEPFDVPQDVSQITQVPKGKFDLSLIEEIKKDKSDENGTTFQVFLATRTYRLRMEIEKLAHKNNSMDDTAFARYLADAWVSALKGATENAKQHSGLSGNVRHMRSSFSNVQVDEVDAANRSAAGFKHPAKRLMDKEMLGPHKPASLDEVQDWTPFDVAAWLYTVQLQKYSEEFYKNQVDGAKLKTLANDRSAVEQLGVEEEDQEELMKSIRELTATPDI